MAGDSMAKVTSAKELAQKGIGEVPDNMDQTFFQTVLREFLAMDRTIIRDNAAKNPSLKKFLSTTKFLVEFARMTGYTDRLPPLEYLEKQICDGGFKFKKTVYLMNLADIVFDKTRHGFGPRPFPFDANHGVKAIQDDGGCVSTCNIRDIFILENMNVPVCRFDPLIFCQSWVLALLRPKFVYRGMVACPKGDYGLVRFIVEVGNSRGAAVRSEVSVPFKNGDNDRLGRFIPFEVTSPEYSFRPNHVFFFVCVFYVNQTKMPVRGIRVANCTVQCVLPPVPDTLENVDCTESFPSGSFDAPPHYCNYTVDSFGDPTYLTDLKKEFYSVLNNSEKLRSAETARAERDIDRLLNGNLLEDKMDVDDDSNEKRKRGSPDGDEPLAKKGLFVVE